MDLTRPITYRGFQFNSAAPEVPSGLIQGTQVDEALVGAAPGVGYSEKRAQGDGRDASDVYLDGRRFVLTGTVYGRSRAEAYDGFVSLRAAMTPTGAYAAQPTEYGYLPLYWDEPTLDSRFVDEPPGSGTRWRHMFANVRPMAAPELRITRDRSGGRPGSGVGLLYMAQFEAKDPRLYVTPQVTADFATDTTGQTGGFINRGAYPSPLNVLLVIKPHTGTGQFRLDTNGSTMHISLPPTSATQQIIRYDGDLKILTLEENAIESLRMDLLTFTTEITHPLIFPGTSTWTVSSAAVTGPPAFVAVPLADQSRMWFFEAFA